MGRQVWVTVGVILGLILTVVVAFRAGVETGKTASMLGTSPPAAGDADEAGYWRYPGAETIQASESPHRGIQFSLEASVTRDDLDKVAAWYNKRLSSAEHTWSPVQGTPPTSWINPKGLAAVMGTDSSRAGAGPRAVKIGVGSRQSPPSSVTAVLSRGAGEDQTHIVITFFKR